MLFDGVYDFLWGFGIALVPHKRLFGLVWRIFPPLTETIHSKGCLQL